MTSPGIECIRRRIHPLREKLLAHPVYAAIVGIEGLQRFAEDHAFAVWDFMSLLKALQRRLCCVEVPWTPPADRAACRLINAIVLAEESDEDGHGGYASHFDLYLNAMKGLGADTERMGRFIEAIRQGQGVDQALQSVEAPETVRRFVGQTFAIVDGGEACAIASAFAFGREDLLPDVFRRIVVEADASSDGGLADFRYYLDRHIDLDGDEHGPMAEMLVDQLCGDDPERWARAEAAAVASLEARVILWDGIRDRLAGQAV